MKQFFHNSKHYALSISLLILGISVQAQSETTTSVENASNDSNLTDSIANPKLSNFKFGVKGGVNLNQLNSPGLYTGGNGGVFATYDIENSFIGFRTGVSFSQLGGGRSNYTNTIEGSPLSTTYLDRQVVFNNLEAPLYVNIYFNQEESIRPRFTLGAVYGYNLSTTEFRDYRITNINTDVYSVYSGDTENVRADFNEHHFDVATGIGIDFDLANGRKAFFEVIYRQGINQMNAVNFGRVGNVGKVYTNSLMLNFGMTLFEL